MRDGDIIDLVQAELLRAELKFPSWPVDAIHAASVLSEESGELVQAANDYAYSEGSLDRMAEEAVQVAAMAFRFLANIEKYKRITGYE